ncbi:MAG: hypothetical protein IT337_08840 [Thermomicrobiales bacterium]|nr:hypothetical protein [Thermomicrobiales bacterium]
MSVSDGPNPLILTANPRLDAALQQGWPAFGPALAKTTPVAAARWLAQRVGDPELAVTVEPLLAALAAPEPEERQEALLALAEIAEEVEDESLADALWEGALELAREQGDPDAMLEATSRLADLAERFGDLLAAAEHYIAFLNWRRQDEHASDAESVEEAFDEIVRLAEADGARQAAAAWTFRQAHYTRLLENDDERAVVGDWEDDPKPYTGWE